MAIQLPILSTFDNRGVKKANSAIGNLTSKVVGFGAAVGAAFAIRGIANFTRDSISAASDLQESLNAVQVAFGDAGDAIIKLGEDAASGLGVSQSEFNAAAVRFSAFADRVVGEGGDVAGFIDDISTRATDFASVFNIDVAEALQVFQSGLAGEAEPLKRFGINLLQSEVQAYALREGIISVGESMTEQDKVQARYGLLMEETAKTAGDFANTSDSLANSQRILKANFEDVRAEVGTALLPILEDLSQFMVNDVIPPLMEFFEDDFPGIVESATPLVEGFVEVLGEIGDSIKGILDIDEDTTLLEGLLTKISDLQADPEFQAFMEDVKDIIFELAPVIPDLVEGIADLAVALAPLLKGAASEVSPVLSGLASIIGDLAASVSLLMGVLPEAEGEVQGFEIAAIKLLVPFTMLAGENGLIARTAESVGLMRQKLEEELPQITLFWDTMRLITETALNDMGAAIEGTLMTMGQVFSKTWDDIVLSTQTWREEQLETIRGAIDEMYQAALDILEAFWTGLKEKFEEISTWFTEIPGKIKAFFDDLPSEMETIGKDIFQGLWNGLKEKWVEVKRWVDEKVQAIKRAFEKALDFGSPSKVFEQYGEWIMEGLLQGMDSLSPEVDAKVTGLVDPSLMNVPSGGFGGRGGGAYYNITIQTGVGDPVRIGEEIVTAVKRYERVSGPVFASA